MRTLCAWAEETYCRGKQQSFTALHATVMLIEAEEFRLGKEWKKLTLTARADSARQGTKDLSTLQLAQTLKRPPAATIFCLENLLLLLVMPLHPNEENKSKSQCSRKGFGLEGPWKLLCDCSYLWLCLPSSTTPLDVVVVVLVERKRSPTRGVAEWMLPSHICPQLLITSTEKGGKQPPGSAVTSLHRAAEEQWKAQRRAFSL